MWDVGGEATDRSQWELEGIWTGTRHGGLRENEKGWDMTKEPCSMPGNKAVDPSVNLNID